MAETATMRQLGERRKRLAARSDELRETFATNCADVEESSYWVQRGYDMAAKVFANRALISWVLRFLGKSKSEEAKAQGEGAGGLG